MMYTVLLGAEDIQFFFHNIPSTEPYLNYSKAFKSVARYLIQKENIFQVVEWILYFILCRYRWRGLYLGICLSVSTPDPVHPQSD